MLSFRLSCLMRSSDFKATIDLTLCRSSQSLYHRGQRICVDVADINFINQFKIKQKLIIIKLNMSDPKHVEKPTSEQGG